MHFKMSSAICFNLDLSKILSSGNGLCPINNSTDEVIFDHSKRISYTNLLKSKIHHSPERIMQPQMKIKPLHINPLPRNTAY